jgi:NAD(P)-dependent dehydrogenase (short-subunit alcohol dehydrogenase family)
MFKRGPKVEGSVVLITGASSGIGRAAAHRFAEGGASLVLAARSATDLQTAAEECRQRGAEVIAVPTDVGVEAQVRELARAAVERFGRIDTWVNNAGVIAYGYFEDMPSKVFDGVLRTNLLGQVYGARAALEQFGRQGSGVLINLSSVWGRVTSPYVVPYVVSKHGIRAFSECLREGIAAGEHAGRIHVCTVLPESVDTPIFQHAANYCGKEAKPVAPVVDVDRAARAIVGSVRRPRPERTVGFTGHAIAAATGLIPRRLFERVAGRLFARAALGTKDQAPKSGNVLGSEPELNSVDGGWRNGSRSRPARVAAITAAVGAPAAAVGLMARRARHKG